MLTIKDLSTQLSAHESNFDEIKTELKEVDTHFTDRHKRKKNLNQQECAFFPH